MSVTPPHAPTVPKLRADAARNRRQLLDAARSAFADEGFDASISEITSRAGLAKGTFFRHFETKEVLIAALLEDRLAQLAELARQVNAEQPPGWRALKALVDRLGELMAADRSVFASLVHREDLRPAATVGFDNLALEVERCLHAAQAIGEIRPDVTDTDVQMLMMAVTGATAHLHEGHPHLAERYRRIIVDGLRTTSPSDLGGPAITRSALQAAKAAQHASGGADCRPPHAR